MLHGTLSFWRYKENYVTQKVSGLSRNGLLIQPWNILADVDLPTSWVQFFSQVRSASGRLFVFAAVKANERERELYLLPLQKTNRIKWRHFGGNSLVLHQSYCCEVKYSEKHSSFGHGNLYNLHLLSNSSPAKTWLSTQNRIFSFTSIDTTLMVQVLPNRKSLDFDYFKSRQMRWYIYIQNSQMNLASGAGNPGWLRTRPKLVCCAT